MIQTNKPTPKSKRSKESTRPINNMEEIITTNKRKINDMLSNSYSSDESLLLGTLNFAHSKFTDYVFGNFCRDMQKLEYNHEYEGASDDSEYDTNYGTTIDEGPKIQLALSNRLSPGGLVDKVWIDIHHPSIKNFQNQFHRLAKSSKKRAGSYNHSNSNNSNKYSNMKTVEIRKLFDRFAKFISRCYQFYFHLLKQIISTYDLSKYIPVKKLCSTLKLDLEKKDPNKISVPITGPVGDMVYVVHKCVLYIGDLSRYRALVAKTYLPSTSISKEDNNNYSKSIELYKLSLLILPSLGDPYNHIAIIDNLKNDKFNVIYNFIRSTLTQKQLPVGFNNLLNFLTKNPENNVIMKKFESYNGLDRSTITKNDRLELLKGEFLCLFGYHLLPSHWKSPDQEGYLLNGHNIEGIENDMYKLLGQLDYHKQIFNDFQFKQMVILMGGFELLIDEKREHPGLNHQDLIVADYLRFAFRYLNNFLEITVANWRSDPTSLDSFSMLLPCVRLFLCWLKERELPKGYLLQCEEYLVSLSKLLNIIYQFFKSTPDIFFSVEDEAFKLRYESQSDFFSDKPVRSRLFKEDVTLKDFQPVNYYLSDFEDDSLYRQEENSILALIGELPSGKHTNLKINDNILRLVAVGSLGKKIISGNELGVAFNKMTGLFDIPESLAAAVQTFESNVSERGILPRTSSHSLSSTNESKKKLANKKKVVIPSNSLSSSSSSINSAALNPKISGNHKNNGKKASPKSKLAKQQISEPQQQEAVTVLSNSHADSEFKAYNNMVDLLVSEDNKLNSKSDSTAGDEVNNSISKKNIWSNNSTTDNTYPGQLLPQNYDMKYINFMTGLPNSLAELNATSNISNNENKPTNPNFYNPSLTNSLNNNSPQFLQQQPKNQLHQSQQAQAAAQLFNSISGSQNPSVSGMNSSIAASVQSNANSNTNGFNFGPYNGLNLQGFQNQSRLQSQQQHQQPISSFDINSWMSTSNFYGAQLGSGIPQFGWFGAADPASMQFQQQDQTKNSNNSESETDNSNNTVPSFPKYF